MQDHLNAIRELLEARQALSQADAARDIPAEVRAEMQARQLVELRFKLNTLHAADVAHILESLPLPQRRDVWDLIHADQDGEVLLEVSDAVRASLIADMAPAELLAAAEQLDTDEIADLAPDLPQDVLQELLESLDSQDRERLQSALAYHPDTVGALMDFDMVTIREDVSLEVTLRYLRRRFEDLPTHTDKLFVVNRQGTLCGVLPLKRLVVEDLEQQVHQVMVNDAVLFAAEDSATAAASAFERYDLVSAPVVDAQKNLVGRITVNEIMDFIRAEETSDKLSMAGLRAEEDLFAPIVQSLKNRWAWLAINLFTALLASRVIGIFTDSIKELVALATLMPIVAGIGGNSGNQTITMIVRGLALGQINMQHMRPLIFKELGVALLNGLIWGSVLALIAHGLYKNFELDVVIMVAITFNLLLAALMGVLIPLGMRKVGRDPAIGSSILITAVTDCGGFFIFLGLASVFLV